jgi:hypothetical protein
MKPDIIAKLNTELRCSITSERQVVYILVEARKLMELTKVKKDFPTLTFCCDWAVHPSLKGEFAQQIITYFDEYEEIFQKKGLMPKDYDFSNLFSVTKHVDFREQLIKLLTANDVECAQLTDNGRWAEFIELYSNVIQDCPLKARADAARIKYVSEVTVSAFPPDSFYRRIAGVVALKWEWKDKQGSTLRSMDSYF